MQTYRHLKLSASWIVFQEYVHTCPGLSSLKMNGGGSQIMWANYKVINLWTGTARPVKIKIRNINFINYTPSSQIRPCTPLYMFNCTHPVKSKLQTTSLLFSSLLFPVRNLHWKHVEIYFCFISTIGNIWKSISLTINVFHDFLEIDSFENFDCSKSYGDFMPLSHQKSDRLCL